MPNGSMVEKLSHQHISIRTGLRKQQSTRGKTIDAMHNQRSLPLQFEFCDEERQSGRSIGALNRHSQKSGRFVENDHSIVFVKDGKVPGETRPAPVFVSSDPIRLSPSAARLSRMFLHWLGADDHAIIKPFRRHGKHKDRVREQQFPFPGAGVLARDPQHPRLRWA